MKHISSFIGNVGDVLSNYGFRKYLSKLGLSPTRIEIRDYYQNIDSNKRKNLDNDFLECEKLQETLLIGGGGFLDFWLDRSRTGTTIDIDLDILKNTSFPLVIQSVGSYPHQTVSENSYSNFSKFLEIIQDRPNSKIILRNDGSYEKLKSLNLINKKIIKGFDNAYLAQNYLEVNKTLFNFQFVAINLAYDQLLMQSEFREGIDTEHFKKEVEKLIISIIDKYNCKIVFVPHISSDIQYILELISELDDRLVREWIVVAEYNGSEDALNYYYTIYAKSIFNVATRFHANILCGLTGKRTISLCALDRVRSVANHHSNLLPLTDFTGNLSDRAMIAIKDYSIDPINKTEYSSVLEDIYRNELHFIDK